MKIPAKFNDIEVLYKAYLAERKNLKDAFYQIGCLVSAVGALKEENDAMRKAAAKTSKGFYYINERGETKFVDAAKVVKRNGKFTTKITKQVTRTWTSGQEHGKYHDKVAKWVEVKENK